MTKITKILICEDEEIMLTALEFRLRRQGFSVSKAVDGKVAKQMLSDGKESFDLIVADVMMPFFTGLELIQYIREELKSDIPVIVISALEQDDIVLKAFKLGATDFITKPFRPNELILRIKRIFQDLK